MCISGEVNWYKPNNRSESNKHVLLKVVRCLKGHVVIGSRPESRRSNPEQAEAVRKYGGGPKR